MFYNWQTGLFLVCPPPLCFINIQLCTWIKNFKFYNKFKNEVMNPFLALKCFDEAPSQGGGGQGDRCTSLSSEMGVKWQVINYIARVRIDSIPKPNYNLFVCYSLKVCTLSTHPESCLKSVRLKNVTLYKKLKYTC